MLRVGIDTREALGQLNLLTLPANKRRRIMRGAGRKVRRDSKDRIKDQKDLSGKTWKARSNGRKKKMLRKLGKNLQVKTSPNKAVVGFGNPLMGKIARAHQDGVTQTVHVKDLGDKKDKDDPATSRQAKSLRRHGYKIRRSRGKGWKTPTVKWITQNLTIGKAGAILRDMAERRGDWQQIREWKIRLPVRSFLGQDLSEFKQLKNFMYDEAFRLG